MTKDQDAPTLAYLSLGLLVGLVVGFFIGAAMTPEAVCEPQNLTCPDQEPVVCEDVIEITETIYTTCNDIDTAEDDAENYEEQTGKKVFEMTSSRECSDFLENSYLRPDKEVISYADTNNGCTLFYVLN